MFSLIDRQRLERTRQIMRGEQLHKLKFADAFRDTLSMMALLSDMTRAFTSDSQYRRLPYSCSSLPATRKPNGRETKNARHKP